MTDHLGAFRAAFNQCRHSTVRNQKISLKASLQRLADATGEAEEADVYGSGALITDFEAEVARLLGKEAALFLPSGTLAQPMALKIWAEEQRSPYVALHATSHLELHEQKGFEILYGLKGVTLGDAHQVPTLAQLQAAALNPLAAVLLELPMREIGGQLPPWDELVAQSQWVRGQGIRLHLDGARLWQCPAAYGKSLAEIAALFDSVYVSFYKDLGGISGAVLAGDQDFIAKARIWLRRAGGNLYSLAPYVIAAREGLREHLPQLPKRRDNAQWLAQQINALAGFSTWPLQPQTNMFRLRIQCQPQRFLEKAARWMRQSGLALITPPYQVGEAHLCCELTIGSAFDQQSRDQWQAAIDAFAAEVLAD
ncbi:beta-eliminating lyase-related protein [Gallaecimonas kandeliae]|uniref:threonine aldolase family protein n=1 Tax=Gallaecimonas kandeliae TaxID=3029055 RepID=UPI002649C21D|nr:beta-eliminating lyase-related protein [Gallaecimonas kandeliae]WKE66997.1 beta-eliminating lyase-related protein [Gallaecimonas kandeliae]